ncbi:MAG: GatB/YqeY domain-containing protein [Patescibacteria group bacterium]|jgi:uncharacterized protein YqeY
MLRDTVRTDFIAAVKNRDKQRASALRNLEAALKNVEIDTRKTLTDEDVIKVLRSELKKRQEAIELYKRGNRQDLVDAEQFEADLIEKYLPAQISREDIGKTVDGILANLGDNPQFGQVMQAAMRELAGKADGKLVSEVVKEKVKL